MAVNIIREKYINDAGVISSIDKDIKTKADYAAHDIIYQELSKTGIPVLSEEADNNKSFDFKKLQWIIDPIDGTLNFHRGFPMAAVSIALWENGKPILGVILNLFNNDVYYSFNNMGAWLNKQKIKVARTTELSDAILATGFPTGSNLDAKNIKLFVDRVQVYKKIRMLGSAALMLSYTACGVFDVYTEKDIYVWDIAAGIAILSEAGGGYLIEPGNSNLKFNVICANKKLLPKVKW